MRTLLICHTDEPLNLEGLARWLASFSELAGLVVLHETRERQLRRVRRELQRVGVARFFDVFAFRFYYKLFLQQTDRIWEENKLRELIEQYPRLTSQTEVLNTGNPNSSEAEAFIRRQAPDLMIARCKTLLKESIFRIPTAGTFVMHPGICPEYRNAHGCFWALANNDLDRVGMTLLRIDSGVDTGPVYGYFTCDYDDTTQSHIVIQHKTVFDNLDAIRLRLIDIHEGRAEPLDTSGRKSGEWGQPWLTDYWSWKRSAHKRRSITHDGVAVS